MRVIVIFSVAEHSSIFGQEPGLCIGYVDVTFLPVNNRIICCTKAFFFYQLQHREKKFTLSQTTNFRLFQTEIICRQQFQK